MDACQTSATNALRSIYALYEPSNIWNMDESGLFFRMGSHQSYLSSTEFRHETRGTELGKQKDRVTMVLACNADGSNVIPARYIGLAKNFRCFRAGDYESLKTRYRSQKMGG